MTKKSGIVVGEDLVDALGQNDREWLSTLVLRDKDVNKIADFCRRVLNTAGTKQYKRIPPGYFIVEQLEKIGDQYRDLTLHFLQGKGKPTTQLVNVLKEVNLFFDHFYRIYFSFDLEEMTKFAKNRVLLKSKLEGLFQTVSRNDLVGVCLLSSVVESVFDMNGPLMAVYL